MKRTKQALAKRARITTRHLHFILSGKRVPSKIICEHLEKVTGIPAADWIFKDRAELVKDVDKWLDKCSRLDICDLLPCPFCGGTDLKKTWSCREVINEATIKAHGSKVHDWYQFSGHMECKKCFISMHTGPGIGPTKKEAYRAMEIRRANEWNTRAKC